MLPLCKWGDSDIRRDIPSPFLQPIGCGFDMEEFMTKLHYCMFGSYHRYQCDGTDKILVAYNWSDDTRLIFIYNNVFVMYLQNEDSCGLYTLDPNSTPIMESEILDLENSDIHAAIYYFLNSELTDDDVNGFYNNASVFIDRVKFNINQFYYYWPNSNIKSARKK